MSPIENVQSNSKAGRKADAIIVSFVLAVPALIAAGGLGLFG